MRALATGQEAGAGHMGLPTTTKRDQGMLAVKGEGTINESQMLNLVSILEKEFGKNNTGVIPTPTGATIADVTDPPVLDKKPFQQGLGRLSSEIEGVVPGTQTPQRFEGVYENLTKGWQEGTATKQVLGLLDNPAVPDLIKHADSAETRQLMGEMEDLYQRKQAEGMTPNPKLMLLLGTWRDKGIPGVRRLVSQGLAPAAAVSAMLSTLQQDETEL